MANREKHERRWLVYSKDLDRIFYFYYKLFNSVSSISKLVNVGSRDWRNFSAKLKSHEMSNEHIINMSSWINLEMRLLKNKIIDKSIQEQINRDEEY